MRRYPELKDSGIKWVGLMPSHWKTSKIGNLFTIKKRIAGREGYPVLSITQRGLKVKDISVNEGQMAADYSGYQFVYPGDFAMNPMDLITGYVGISSQFGVTSPAYRVFSINDSNSYSAEYYLLLLELCYRRRIFYGYGKGVASKGRWCLPAKNFNRFYVPLPPLPEQEQIARFLGWKTTDIDSLISVRQKQVEKLKELRTSVISSAVTRGLDPSAPMKDSGVKWIGMVPRHWDIQRMTRFFSFRKGLSITKRDLMECGVAVVNYGQIHSKENNGVGLKNDLVKFVDETYLDSCPSALTENGDSIFADTSEDILGCGNSIYVDWNVKIFAGYHTLIAHPGEIGKHRYFAYLFKSEAWRNQVRENVNGVKVYSITQGMLKNTSILLPPLSEQEKIVKYLDTRTAEIDKLIATYEDEIARLSEFKTALISEVVTGKIDVRGVRVPESVVQKKEALQCRQT